MNIRRKAKIKGTEKIISLSFENDYYTIYLVPLARTTNIQEFGVSVNFKRTFGITRKLIKSVINLDKWIEMEVKIIITESVKKANTTIGSTPIGSYGVRGWTNE